MTFGNTEYPEHKIDVLRFPADFDSLFPKPAGLIHSDWPPNQLAYLKLYLEKLGCKTIIRESHYVDRDFILDLAAFYARSLRNYPNYCGRLHFLSSDLPKELWTKVFDVSDRDRESVADEIRKHYLGFTVVKPLPGSPVGRTVLKPYPSTTSDGDTRSFGGIRKYTVHVAGLQLTVDGLAFQQQDQGVSACATTALWTSLHKVAHDERIEVPAPAQITEAASRYLLAEGRSLPSEGLNIQQICEAVRGTGLQPLVVRAVSLEEDRAQLTAYVNSGFPPVLAIEPVGGGTGHAICCVGIKMGEGSALTAPAHHPHHFRLADGLTGIYIHDDRLGPYASAAVQPWTARINNENRILMGIQIKWPDQTQAELSILRAMIVPVPDKVRMPISRVLASGAVVAELAGMYFKDFERRVILSVAYKLGHRYVEEAMTFGLTSTGLAALCCDTVLSRFVGLIEISANEGPLFDVLLDTTETRANPSALAFIKRAAFPASQESALRELAGEFGAALIA